MAEDYKLQALAHAVNAAGTAAEIVARAHAYHAFLTGGDAPATPAKKTDAKPATAPSSTATTKPAAGKKAAATSTYTQEQVRDILRKVSAESDSDEAKAKANAKACVAAAGIASFKDAKPEHYAAIVDAANKFLAPKETPAGAGVEPTVGDTDDDY
jgi:hypothetical protein